MDLRTKSECAKMRLAKVSSARIACQHAGKTLVVPLDRDRLRKLTDDLVLIAAAEIDSLLEARDCTPDQVDQVLLIGGARRLLMIREMLEQKFPGRLNVKLDPEQIVAWGAAWLGHWIARGAVPPDEGELAVTARPGGEGEWPIRDVATRAIGVAIGENGQEKIRPLIARDESLPCSGGPHSFASAPAQLWRPSLFTRTGRDLPTRFSVWT